MTVSELLDQIVSQLDHIVSDEMNDQFRYNKSKFGNKRFKLDRELALRRALEIPVLIGKFNGRRELNSTDAIDVLEWREDIAVKSRESSGYKLQNTVTLTVCMLRSKLSHLCDNRSSNRNRNMTALTLHGPEPIRSVYYNRFSKIFYLNI